MVDVITTKRLVLREIRIHDIEFVSRLLSDPMVMQFYPKPLSQSEAEAWIERRREQYHTHGFKELAKQRLISLVRPVNEASQRVAQRIGMRVERTANFADLEHLVFSINAPAGA